MDPQGGWPLEKAKFVSDTGKSAGKGDGAKGDMAKSDSKRAAIRRKVEASAADLARRAPAKKPAVKKAPVVRVAAKPGKVTSNARPADALRTLAADYPFALLAGGAAIGVLLAAVMPRGVRLAAGSKLSRRAAAVAGIAAELGLAYGKRALEAAAESAGEAREKAGEIGESAANGASAYSRSLAETARDAATTIGRQAIRLRSHLRH
jgi:hypothetical protein